MPKSAKKRKAKRADFNKVKLKVGKKLPKADNVTDTTFKSRAIHLPDQLKTDASQPTNFRQQNVKDLLTQCNHYSASVRHEAITGLKDLLVRHPAVVPTHLSSVVEKCSELFVDKDPVVRKAAIGLLRHTFGQASANQISPFFSLISAHLCCAMTHIFEDIRHDSLTVLDVCLEHFPSLLTSRSGQILTNFVGQISSMKDKGVKKDATSSSHRLSVNLNSRLTSLQWRSKVLNRLHHFLKAMLSESDTGDRENGEEQNKGVVEEAFDGTKSLYVQVFACRKPPSSTGYLIGTTTPNTASRFSLREFAESLLPLLLETWVESSPGEGGSLVHADVTDLLQGVVDVLRLLWQCLQHREQDKQQDRQKTAFLQHYKNIHLHLMSGFPYMVMEQSKKGKGQQREQSGGTNVQASSTLNLGICDVMTCSLEQDSSGTAEGWLDTVLDFLVSCLSDVDENSAEHMESVLRVIQHVIKVLPQQDLCEDLLTAVHECYQSEETSNRTRQQVVHFLAESYLQRDPSLPQSKVLTNWVASLPHYLVTMATANQQQTEEVLHVVQSAATRGHSCMVENLIRNFQNIYGVGGLLCSVAPPLQRHLVQLLYHLPLLGGLELSTLAQACRQRKVGAPVVKYLVQILLARSSAMAVCEEEKPPVDTPDILSFLMSIMIGHSVDELKDLQQEKTTDVQVSGYRTQIYCVSLELRLRQKALAKFACECLLQFSSPQQVWEVVETVLERCLGQFHTLPMDTVYAVLVSMVTLLPPGTEISRELLTPIMHCCWAALDFAIHNRTPVSDGEAAAAEENWQGELLHIALQAMASSQGIVQSWLECVEAFVKGDTERSGVEAVAQVLLRVMQTTELQRPLQQTGVLQRVVKTVTACLRQDENEKLLSSMVYQASLIK
ncbi:TEX10 [Branchiostoma lanceolatum]|uniref:TEX10 protein n=1 Tax=Branchiostoma lanceolatum TaxID=7740 RepID=A0A8J9VF33_BRALA|nr:TEX10 [Branchiostoma lanceolatum]